MQHMSFLLHSYNEHIVSSNGPQQILNSKYYVAWSLHVMSTNSLVQLGDKSNICYKIPLKLTWRGFKSESRNISTHAASTWDWVKPVCSVKAIYQWG